MLHSQQVSYLWGLVFNFRNTHACNAVAGLHSYLHCCVMQDIMPDSCGLYSVKKSGMVAEAGANRYMHITPKLYYSHHGV